jgi:transposase-like protein
MPATCSAAPGNSVASITRLLGVVSRSTIYKYVPELTNGRQPAILEAAPTAVLR